MPVFTVQPTPAPQLTSHLRCQLLTQYRADLRHDVAELEYLTRNALHDRRSDKRRTYRIGQLHTRIADTRDALAELGEVA